MNKNRHQMLTQAAQVHRLNLRKNVERRLEAAKAQGNEALVKMLEAELNYIG
jgi:ribosome-binding protein aMBF1 (putative translation factor)